MDSLFNEAHIVLQQFWTMQHIKIIVIAWIVANILVSITNMSIGDDDFTLKCLITPFWDKNESVVIPILGALTLVLLLPTMILNSIIYIIKSTSKCIQSKD